MKIVHCSACGEEVTMPSFKDRKPYGYTCFARLFGKSVKPVTYVPVEKKLIIRRWADLKDSLSPEGWELKKDCFTIHYIYSFKTIKSRPVANQSEFAIQDDNGDFWIPKDELKKVLNSAKKKLGLTTSNINDELKGVIG